MKEILEEIERWRSDGERVVVATVVATRRSAPRPVGTSLAVSESGKICGSVSGGCVESDVFENAMEVLRLGRAEAPVLRDHGRHGLVRRPALRWGDRRVRGARRVRLLERLAELRSGDGRGVLFTVVEGEGVGAKALAVEGDDPIGDGVPVWALEQFDELVRRGRNRLLESDGVKVFAEWYGPPPRLVVYGAVDTAESLCRGAKLLGWTAIVADARGMFLTPERMPSADRLIAAWPKEALAEIAPDHQTAVVVLTHDDKFDEPALMAALESEAFYVGALGSRRTTARRRERLLEAGVDEAALDRIMGPCGLDIGADTQEETALSILAEILAVRAGRSGGPLRDSKHRIHVETS